MTFNTLEDAAKFYNDYAKAAGFSRRVRSKNKKRNEIKNQLITCSREGKWKSKISPNEKTNPTADLNCPARIYIHTLKDVGAWIISKIVLHHSHPCHLTQLELEDDQLIKLSFWADTRSRAAFEYFGDVILFDTTYNTNRYNLVCGSFVEVNHHGQSTLLGCALMKNEDIESFKWLFQCWLRCMRGNAPKGILTDQCASMKRAIEACMPTKIHRSCIWHITKKIPSKLNGYKGHIEIEQEMNHVVWNSHTKELFDRNWNDFLLKYGLMDNKWLSSYSVYEVGEQVSSSIFNKFAVTYDSVAAQVKCQCLLFELRGILYRHALSVLSFELKVKRRHTHIKSSHNELLLEPRSKRFDELVFRSQNICEFASKFKKMTAILFRAYDKVMVEMEELKGKRKGTYLLFHEDANLESINELQSRPRVRTRGHPKNRLGSKLDKHISNPSKKKKTKALSELNLFDAASLVQPNSSQYHGHVMNYQFREPAAVDNFLGV
ncbi:hypothetical protein Ahy_B02g058174 [Arachis hypogaea]|uniref:Uncharacterized protein n=1 Tax=Arachis hypogaea TaxID=3818 RepID=A0A445AE06_ARAHY|nr:hypothetical protein Ahy_B02g058174 [Arachis hypogaea]